MKLFDPLLMALIFQSTLPVGGATYVCKYIGKQDGISIHAPRGGSDGGRWPWTGRQRQFQSTLPVGGATDRVRRALNHGSISIHAPRGGSDTGAAVPPLGEKYFNPRSPWGERHYRKQKKRENCVISIHAPRGGSDEAVSLPYTSIKISIHAPRGGSDDIGPKLIGHLRNFNPRSPWGERRQDLFHEIFSKSFQSTLPVGGATYQPILHYSKRLISIHAPRGGSDSRIEPGVPVPPYFNPRSPWGERRL